MNTSTLRIAALLVSCLVLPGCGENLPRVRTVPLTGDTAGIGKLEGSWYDSDGALVVAVSGGWSPRLAIQLPPWMELTRAHAEGGRVSFYLETDRSREPYPSTLDREGEQEYVIYSEDPPPDERSGCLCGYDLRLSHLVHDPSPWWLMKQSTRRTTHEVGKARDAVMDRLARTL